MFIHEKSIIPTQRSSKMHYYLYLFLNNTVAT